eukprot:1149959-Pelagomonas_calceolata.AAC.9
MHCCTFSGSLEITKYIGKVCGLTGELAKGIGYRKKSQAKTVLARLAKIAKAELRLLPVDDSTSAVANLASDPHILPVNVALVPRFLYGYLDQNLLLHQHLPANSNSLLNVTLMGTDAI